MTSFIDHVILPNLVKNLAIFLVPKPL